MSKKDKYVTKDHLWKIIKWILAPIMIILKLIAIILGLLASIVLKIFEDCDFVSDTDDNTDKKTDTYYDDILF